MVKRNLPSCSRTVPPRPGLSPRLAIRTPGVPDLGQVTGDFSLGGLSSPAAASPPGGRSSPGPARAASPRGRIVSRGSRAPTTGPRRRRRRRRSERVARSPCARSLGSLGPSGKAGGRRAAALPGFRSNSNRGARDRPIAKEWPGAAATTEDPSGRRMQENGARRSTSPSRLPLPPGCPGCRARAGPPPPPELRARLVRTGRRRSLGAAGGEGAGVGGGSPGAGGAAGSAADPWARAGRRRNK